MNKLILIVLIIIYFSSLLGSSIRLPVFLPPLNIYIQDLFLGLLAVLILGNFRNIYKKVKDYAPIKIFIFFLIYSSITLIISPFNLNFNEKIISALYIFRYTVYFSIYPATLFLLAKNKENKTLLKKIINVAGFGLILIGWLQYFLYPDLRNIAYLGWDPHFKRIFGLVFDPNYLGLLFVLFFILRHTSKKMDYKELIIQVIIIVTIGFTYSRSSYIALFVSILYFAIQSKKFLFYATLEIVLLLSLLLLPRPGGVGVELERLFSVSERIQNWKIASQLISKYPVFGVGFNSLRFARKSLNTLPDNWLTSHSAAGVDNSFLFVAGTTGIIGLFIYVYFLLTLFKTLSITGQTVLIAVFVHALFLNTLFFTVVLIWFWTIAALEFKSRTKEKS